MQMCLLVSYSKKKEEEEKEPCLLIPIHIYKLHFDAVAIILHVHDILMGGYQV